MTDSIGDVHHALIVVCDFVYEVEETFVEEDCR